MAFRALVTDRVGDGVASEVRELDESQLPDGDVTVRVEWSSLNYKDGMILRGLGRLVRDYPHVGGVDLAGTVEASASGAFQPGDRVVVTGWRVGEAWWGGYAELAKVKAEWATRLPASLTTRQAMILGTAGLTAMMGVAALEEHGLEPGKGSVLVTGAAGGLGSIAVHLLARLGYHVAASTGRSQEHDYLRHLGAADLLDRSELAAPPERPLLSARWAGCIDAVGGSTLGHVVSEMDSGASIAVAGNTAGNELTASVLPFLLRGVNLLGMDSVAHPSERRGPLWERMGGLVDAEVLEGLASEAGLDDLPRLAEEILGGNVRGRVVVTPSS